MKINRVFSAVLAGLSLMMFSGCTNPLTHASGKAGARSAIASGQLLNGLQWADTDGNPIQAHGAGIIRVGNYYYLFGENRNSDSTFYAVSCYRSSDLVNWEFRNNVLTMNSAPELNTCNIERPKVIYNASTGQFVMWMHWENGVHYGEAKAAVAYGSTVDGNYTYQGSFRPYEDSGVTDHGRPGYMSRDCNLFVDDDGTAYFISSSNENMDLHLYRLTADYRHISILETKLFIGSQREAPVMFKRNGYYFLLTSGCTGWHPNQAKYSVSASITGFSSLHNVGDSVTYYSQPTTVAAVQGSSGTSYLYWGDRWAGDWGGKPNESAYIALPLTFPSNTSMSMGWSNTVSINTAAGTITSSNEDFRLISASSGKAMEVKGQSTENNAAVQQWSWWGGNSQRWTFNYDGDGYFALTNVNSGKVLDVPHSSTSAGTALQQWSDWGGDNQRWTLTDKGNGEILITNKNSGMAAEVYEWSTSDGGTVAQGALTGDSNQRWKVYTD